MNKIKKIIRSFLYKKKPEYLNHDEFWVQDVSFNQVENRFLFFENICRDKKILHFGCTDWPIFAPGYNLHIKLSKVASVLHGFDIDLEGIENLKKYVDQPYFSQIEQLGTNEYDVCVIPETIEHVENVGAFLKDISKVQAKEFYITAPNCFAQAHMQRNFYGEGNIKEVVHPDHNCWYSPFTLKNVIEKYSGLSVIETFLLNDDTMVCCKAVRKS